MIHRFVKMTFAPEKLSTFLDIFDSSKDLIRNSEGCLELKLLQHSKFPNILYTYSIWKDLSHLEAYRNSELFKNTWTKTRRLFAAPPEAWSTVILRETDSTN